MAIPTDIDLRRHNKPLRHGDARTNQRTRLYRIWRGIRTRVLNASSDPYPRYGGRGIKISPEWDDYRAFRDWALSHGYADGLTIDRINNDGDYCPSNCRWTDRKTQQRNRSNSLLLTYRGKTATLAELAEDAGLKYLAVHQRINLLGWSLEDALETPVGRKESHR